MVARNIPGAGLTEKDGEQGIAHDPAEGLTWDQVTAERGFARAVFNMAVFRQDDHAGHGVDHTRAGAFAAAQRAR